VALGALEDWKHRAHCGVFMLEAGVEGVDLPAILGLERQVKMRRLLLGVEQTQGGLGLWWHELDPVRRGALSHNHDAERLERLEEERLARCVVADSELDMVEHEFS
jgi:hypothetical protein